MKTREAINLTLHILVGAALAALVCWHPAWIIFVTFIYAWLREQAQHRWELREYGKDMSEERGVTLYRVEKSTFFGWMTGHRIWEVFQWVIGSAIVAVLWIFIG